MNAFGFGLMIGAGRPANAIGSVDSLVARSQQAAEKVTGSEILLLLPTAVGTILILFLLWRSIRVPGRPGRTDTRHFRCSLRGHVVIAEFQVDAADGTPVAVNWCTAFCPAVTVRCKKRCLKSRNGNYEHTTMPRSAGDQLASAVPTLRGIPAERSGSMKPIVLTARFPLLWRCARCSETYLSREGTHRCPQVRVP